MGCVTSADKTRSKTTDQHKRSRSFETTTVPRARENAEADGASDKLKKSQSSKAKELAAAKEESEGKEKGRQAKAEESQS
jgi:hypothetical protein